MKSQDQDVSSIIPKETDGWRTGYVSIIGCPNVGKSTLMNALLGERLSIVTPKPQTTRQRILGILSEPGVQIIFVDTPGVLEPEYKLQEFMLRSAVKTIQESDVTIAMVDATRSLRDLDEELTGHLTYSAGPVILAINKIDRIKKPMVLPLIDEAHSRFPFSVLIPISALNRDGLENLLALVIERLPVGPPMYPPDMLTDQPERFFVGEIVREHLFTTLRDELPYASAVQVDDFKDRDNGKTYIRATIVVEKTTQKAIIIGHKGHMLKKIGTAAKESIETFLERPVYLDLWVKVIPTWRKRETDLKRLGYS